MNVSFDCPRDDSRWTIEIVSESREIFVVRSYDRRAKNPRREIKRLMRDKFFSEVLRQCISVGQVLEDPVVDLFVAFFRHFSDVNELMVVQGVVVDFLINVGKVAV